MAETPESGTLDPQEPVATDVACAGCGYNLRGLTLGMQCPECAMPVGRSLRGPYLRYADPAWVARISRGTSLFRWGILLQFLLGFGAAILAGAIAARAGAPGTGFVLIASAGGFVGQILALWATFLVIEQEPRISLHEDPFTLRKVVRVAAVTSFWDRCSAPRRNFRWSEAPEGSSLF